MLMKSSLLLLSCLLLGCGSASQVSTHTVKTVDLPRYMGKWYEIARFDHSFERHMREVTAEYTLLPTGKIRVVNSGYNVKKGRYTKAIGKAKQPNAEEPGRLKVSFFLWFYGSYNILELDEEGYNYALIGGDNDKYLWLLSRTPQLSDQVKQLLLDKATARGYAIKKLIWVEQKKQP